MTRHFVGILGLALLTLTLGCASVNLETYSKPATGQRVYGKVKKVAVLPFDSAVEGGNPKAINDTFYQKVLSARTFDTVEEPRYVSELMKKLKLRNTEGLDREIVRKMGEELKAEALIMGNVLLFGLQKDSEVTEFALQTNMLDAETGDILWSGRTYVKSSTSWGEVFGVNKGPSPNGLVLKGVSGLVARLDSAFRGGREAEVERMLEAERAQKLSQEGAPGKQQGAPAATAPAPTPPKEEEGEEILLKVKPK